MAVQETPQKRRDYTWFIVGAIAIVAVAAVLLIIQPTNQVLPQSAITATQGAEFMATNATAEGVVTTDSGLQYRVVTEGDGPKPTASDTVTVHYTGKFLDSTTFDSSVDRGQPVSFPLDAVIPGWTEGLQLMPVGSTYEFWIPPDLAYGSAGRAPAIPPNATLYFEVQLLGIAGQ